MLFWFSRADWSYLQAIIFIILRMQLDLEVKQELEQIFIFRSLLGQGSFGCVYECEDRRDGQIYAVKIIAKSNVKKSKMECLREEARLLSSINHPNIVKVYEFVETNLYIFLRMEIIRNGTLEKLIKQRHGSGNKFSDQEMASVMGAIFRCLHYIHSMNIIHRDIKPDNILIPCCDDLGKLKMADFGLSTKLDFHYPKIATSKCGTLLYMAPEVLNNLSYTKSVDIWSCSIIMFYLAQGRHPFYQPKMTSDDYKRRIKSVVFPQLTNSLAQDFISRISKVEASERYTTQQALQHPWLTRKFDDEIPQSLHESFQGFQKSHTISNIFKLLIATRNLCQGPAVPQVSELYLKKKDQQSSSFPSLKLKNVRSRKLEKEVSTISHSSKSSQIENSVQKDNKQNLNKVEEKQTPAIAKLNAIFESLLERKPKNLKQKFKTEGATVVLRMDREQRESPPKILPFKDKLQNEIEKLVRGFKNEQTNRTFNNSGVTRRMLPSNKRSTMQKFPTDKEDFRVLTQSSGSSSVFKIRHRKKAPVSHLRLYD